MLLQTRLVVDEPEGGAPVAETEGGVGTAAWAVMDAGRSAAGSAFAGMDAVGLCALHRMLESLSATVDGLSDYVDRKIEAVQSSVASVREDPETAVFRKRSSFEVAMQETLDGVLVIFAGMKEGLEQMQQNVTRGVAAESVMGPPVRKAKHAVGPLVRDTNARIDTLMRSLGAAQTAVRGLGEVGDRAVFEGRLEALRKALATSLPQADAIADKLVGLPRAVALARADAQLGVVAAELAGLDAEVRQAQELGSSLRVVVSTLVSGLTATFTGCDDDDDPDAQCTGPR